MDLSIVIPAYNESVRLGATLSRVSEYACARARPHEIIVVDDGSTDATCDLVRAAERDGASVRLLINDVNRGKGYSVSRGMLAARGRIVLFTDADLSTPIEEADALIERLEGGHDLAIGSRALRQSKIEVHQPFFRENMGRVFNLLFRLIFMDGIHDSQCGFKGLRREAAQDLFSRLTVHGFCFDVEIVYLARKLGYRVVEVPVRWRNSPDTRVHALLDPARMFLDMFRIRWRHRRVRPRAAAGSGSQARSGS